MSIFCLIRNFRNISIPKFNWSHSRTFYCSPISRYNKSVAELNTNVIKDVILFKYENPRFFKVMNFFAFVQFGFWSYLSITAYQTLRDVPGDENADSWWKRINLGENKYRNTISILTFLIGYGILCVSWMYTLKSVRYLILNKGGQKCTIVTYTPYGANRMFTLGLENMSFQASRHNSPSYVPFKVKGHLFHYLLDMRGEFKNAQLFDYTVGLRRNLKR